MFTHLLVPLDGSRMAESALPAAAGSRRAPTPRSPSCTSSRRNAPSEVHSERHLVTPRRRRPTWRRWRAGRCCAGLRVPTHVHAARGERRGAQHHRAHGGARAGPRGHEHARQGRGAAAVLRQPSPSRSSAWARHRCSSCGRRTEPPRAGRRGGRSWRPWTGTRATRRACPSRRSWRRPSAAALHLLMVIPTLGRALPAPRPRPHAPPGGHAAQAGDGERRSAGLPVETWRRDARSSGCIAAGTRDLARGPGARHRAHGAAALRGPGGHGHPRPRGNRCVLGRERRGARRLPRPGAAAPGAAEGVGVGGRGPGVGALSVCYANACRPPWRYGPPFARPCARRPSRLSPSASQPAAALRAPAARYASMATPT